MILVRHDWTNMDFYDLWCKTFGCTHGHCPLGCEHPQPFAVVLNGETATRLVCGRCWVVDSLLSEMVPVSLPTARCRMTAHPIDGIPGLFVALIHMAGVVDKNGVTICWALVVGPNPNDPTKFNHHELHLRYLAWRQQMKDEYGI